MYSEVAAASVTQFIAEGGMLRSDVEVTVRDSLVAATHDLARIAQTSRPAPAKTRSAEPAGRWMGS